MTRRAAFWAVLSAAWLMVLLMACAAPAGPAFAGQGYDSFKAADKAKIRDMAQMYAAMYEVNPALVLAVIRAESAYDRYARSPVGARGVMQIMPSTGDALGMEDQGSLNDNIEAGVRYLRTLLDRFGDETLALAAYNAGPAAVEKHGGVPPFEETRAYLKRVMEFRAQEARRAGNAQ